MVDWTGLHVTALLLLTAARHGGETEQKFRANSQSKLVQSKLSDQTVIRNGRVHFLGPHTPTRLNGPLHPQTHAELHFLDLYIRSSI